MIPDLAHQLAAASPCPDLIDLRTTYQIKPGSQVERVLQLLDEGKKAWTYEELTEATGFARNAINVAVFRLKRAGLIEVAGTVPGRTKPRVLLRATI